MTKPIVTIYTDGGCSPNPGPGGWAAILIDEQGRRKELSGNASDATNNRMELMAAIEALRALKVSCAVTVITDSEYLRQGITSWLAGWKRHNWRTKDRKPVKNRDLWEALDEECQRHTIDWRWTAGHDGDPFNERADYLVWRAREALPET